LRTLVIDTATAACSVALFDGLTCVDARHEVVGRGHAERLLPMIAELQGQGRAPHILVDCGPGSFTGVRVGLAAALGLAIGWGADVAGFSSLALVAAMAQRGRGTRDGLVVVLEGGHGEVFAQSFGPAPLTAISQPMSVKPAEAFAMLNGKPAYGSGVRYLVALDDRVRATELLPDAREAMRMPEEFRQRPAKPVYGRAPDAKPAAT